MLSDTTTRNARPKGRAYKLADERGMYLLVTERGKYWRLDYRFGGKRKTLALGVYPDVPLRKARESREDARRLLASGIDPMHARKAAKGAPKGVDGDSFELVAREWFQKFSEAWAKGYADKVLARLEQKVFPWVGARRVGEIVAPELLGVVRRVESQGTVETAHRVLRTCGQVFRYAVATGRAQRDPSADLRGALPPAKKRHFPSIKEPRAVGALLRAIDGYSGSAVTQAALRLASLVFVRPGELRGAEWREFHLDASEWRIPAARMKMRQDHLVPLSTQALAILRDLQKLTGEGRYVFPGVRSKDRPMSENTLNAALRNLGYTKDQMTAHGFRSMASTLLNEQGWNRDAIERQLAHAEGDDIRAAYNFAEHLPERRRMMQAWSDYLDSLKAGASVSALHAA